MRVFTVAALAALTVAARPAAAQEPKAEVLTAVEDFMRGLKARDLDLLNSRIDSTTRFTLVRPGPGGSRVIVLAGAEFIRVATRADQPAIDEPIRNPVVQVDGDVATVWAEYQVRRDGKVSHCGHDAFHLARVGGRWRIINLIDSFQPQGCGDPWP
ncbi:MAG: hypothetical protein AB7L66_00645 [Gemmatimonadales bacterium]